MSQNPKIICKQGDGEYIVRVKVLDSLPCNIACVMSHRVAATLLEHVRLRHLADVLAEPEEIRHH